jgi:hypothetical protein
MWYGAQAQGFHADVAEDRRFMALFIVAVIVTEWWLPKVSNCGDNRSDASSVIARIIRSGWSAGTRCSGAR